MLGRRRPAPPDVDALIDDELGAGRPTGWFEPLYAALGGRQELLPWYREGPHPYLEGGLPVPAPATALVVGCGLGDDAAWLAGLGYRVTAFDLAPTAVRAAGARHPDAEIDWRVADLLELPDDLRPADLVVEVHTVDHLPGVVRDAAMQAIATLVAPGGSALIVTRLATSREVADRTPGPPWPQAPSELAAYRAGGLLRVSLEHPEPDEHGCLEVRLVLGRAPVPGEDRGDASSA